ncbi:hypothetical protein THASP1DRAFT_29886 [Thamnocephalis sphaerospora]|uniref:Transmembrane protein 198 n=1 Tax=Thamnocephalis sphaerospora TaxID=78915 RepID=A0A4P9XQW8_9FUNG|nr:hypothetical protein THASP1DRAFT_29886 [Thamnocephalis sphaerospora]|eukprot:RKP08312.1 hypothetical protein THASP1DRAFT_29886 [Thamnocephalis sphaerospora]
MSFLHTRLPAQAARLLAFMLCCQAMLGTFLLAAAEETKVKVQDAVDALASTTAANTPQSIAAAVIFIVIGFLFCFFGYRLFRVTLFLVGFCVAGLLAFAVCTNVAPLDGTDGDDKRRTIYLAVSVAVGFVGGLICMCLWSVGVFLIGALGGVMAALYILALAPEGLIHSGIWRGVFIAVFALVGALLTLKFERPVIIVGTSLSGAFALGLGIDFFAHTNLGTAVSDFLSSRTNYHAETKTYIMLGGIALLAIIGMVVQFRFFTGSFRRGKAVSKH